MSPISSERTTARPLALALALAIGSTTAIARPQDPDELTGSEIEAENTDDVDTAPYYATFADETSGWIKDNVAGAHVRFATFPIRPMIYLPAEGGLPAELWTVNHLRSTVEVFAGGQYPAANKGVIGVPLDPCAIAYWTGPNGNVSAEDDELLVVCRGTWAVVRINRQLREVVGLEQLRPSSTYSGPARAADAQHGLMAEPGDIVVDDETNMAFVSCSGADSVIQINLAATTNAIVRVFHESVDAAFQCKYPLFLTLKPGTPTTPPEVFVSPMISGNNSAWNGGLHGGTEVDQPLSGYALPDRDLFRIIPYSGSNPGSVQAVATGMGTLLFAGGIQPTTNAFWQLNTEALNHGSPQGEPSVNAKFVESRISVIAALPGSGTVTPSTILDLDPLIITPNAPRAVGQPFGLTFETGTGNAFVAGLLTDNVVVVDPTCTSVLHEIVLPAGSIPRQVVLRTAGSTKLAYVYCWGDSKIRVYEYVPGSPWTSSLRSTLLQSKDLSPADVADGRRIFFDGGTSGRGTQSCASCHVEGGSDFLVWNLGNLPLAATGGVVPLDDKGGMVTQTLVGIRREVPFHWRAERTLDDFNEFAFPGLLGHPKLSEPDFDKLEAFLFSLANPANPNQNRNRIVDDQIQAPIYPPSPSDATQGMEDFFKKGRFGAGTFACADCHAAPTGTLNDIVNEFLATPRPRRSHLKIAPFHELWRKEQSTVSIKFAGGSGTELRSFLGAGVDHAGLNEGVFDFVNGITGNPAFPPSQASLDQSQENIASFVHQWDSGLAPAAHIAYLLDASSNPTVTDAELRQFLKPQANPVTGTDPGCDLVAIGYVPDLGGPSGAKKPLRWYFDRYAPPPIAGTIGAFLCEDPSFSNRALSDFTTIAASNGERYVFLGLPVGTGERFAIDYDADGYSNLHPSETAPEDPSVPTPATTSPGLALGSTVDVRGQTARVARIQFRTDQMTKAKLEYRLVTTPAGTWKSVTDDAFGRYHSIVVNDLKPSTDGGAFMAWNQPHVYEFRFTVTNRGNVSSLLTDPAWTFETKPFVKSSPTLFDPRPFDPNNPALPFGNFRQRQRMNEHYIDESSLVISPLAGNTNVTVSMSTSFRRGDDANGLPRPAADRVIVGHVLKRAANGTVTAPTVDVSVAATAATFLEIWAGSATGRQLEVDGASGGTGGAPFVVSRDPTNMSGDTILNFRVPGVLTSGEELIFVVDAVVELYPTTVSSGAWTSALTSGPPTKLIIPSSIPWSPVPDNGHDALSQWSFPDGGETKAAPSYRQP